MLWLVSLMFFSITGASSGIGRATALLFAKHKYQLSLTGRNEAALKDVAKECVQQGITENDPFRTMLDWAVMFDVDFNDPDHLRDCF
ncbi:hypothetical protein Y032_0006g2993 [Ancylostoma ceylanicum]|uniref:Oxidoreductase, short chain dehydrogenase/reductase family protein n=1 Tax=Ancylostoma ceylanicum TaxID=53326 RepID=A0A016VPH6_9BILA|nr:hypothetical protein Y032_0006g2993 [Ancylostoma ceylanicum]